jgi:hypothetical protein
MLGGAESRAFPRLQGREVGAPDRHITDGYGNSAAMTATHGSAGRMAAEAARVVRCGATERRLHTIHAVSFVVMLLTSLVLYLPSSRRSSPRGR